MWHEAHVPICPGDARLLNHTNLNEYAKVPITLLLISPAIYLIIAVVVVFDLKFKYAFDYR